MANPFTRDRINLARLRMESLAEEIRHKRADDIESRGRRTFLRVARFLIIVFKEMHRGALFERAGSLTYVTILSIFPLLALVSGLASVFYGQSEEEKVISFIERRILPDTGADMHFNFPGEDAAEEAQIRDLIGNLRELSESYRSNAGNLGLAGFIGVLVTTAFLYYAIEDSFEASWQTGHERSITRTVTGFTSLLVFIPLAVGISVTVSSMAVSTLSRFIPDDWAMPTEVMQDVVDPNPPDPFFTVPGVQEADDSATTKSLLLASTPTPKEKALREAPPPMGQRVMVLVFGLMAPIFNGLVLALAYMLIPQTKVKAHFALLGGILAGFLWEIAKAGFFYYLMLSAAQRQVLKTLGAVPLFLIWLYFTWIVFLFGNAVTYVAQNRRRLMRHYFVGRDYCKSDLRLLMTILLMVGDAFDKGSGGLELDDLLRRVGVRHSEIEEALKSLEKARLVTRTETDRWVLARPASRIRLRDVLSLGCDADELLLQSQRRTAKGEPPELELAVRSFIESLHDLGGQSSLEDLLTKHRIGDDPGQKEPLQPAEPTRPAEKPRLALPAPEHIEKQGKVSRRGK